MSVTPETPNNRYFRQTGDNQLRLNHDRELEFLENDKSPTPKPRKAAKSLSLITDLSQRSPSDSLSTPTASPQYLRRQKSLFNGTEENLLPRFTSPASSDSLLANISKGSELKDMKECSDRRQSSVSESSLLPTHGLHTSMSSHMTTAATSSTEEEPMSIAEAKEMIIDALSSQGMETVQATKDLNLLQQQEHPWVLHLMSQRSVFSPLKVVPTESSVSSKSTCHDFRTPAASTLPRSRHTDLLAKHGGVHHRSTLSID